ncbi:unnamed protein product [marine sediment metagenome]|uniref:Uncharacterized protein n=1 Tax=marine sediment metagenome TaxID=412755 RepID=X1SJ33_9ZZZZ
MNITSMEVIRPGVAAIGVVAGEKIELTYGDTLRVDVSFWYRGLARETILEGAIGKLHAFPTDWLEVLLKSGTTIDIPESFEFTLYEKSVEIPITSDIDPGTDYDLSVSLRDYREAGHPTEVDVIDIVGIPPDYKLIQETIHPASYVWEGEEEVCIIEFPLTPEQIPFTQWGGLKLADMFASAVEAEGNSLLEVKVYEDTTPLFWTNYRVEIMAAVASEEQGVAAPVWPWLVAIGAILVKLPWAFIIKGTLTIIGIWLVGWIVEKLIKAVDRVIHKPPALTDEIIDSLGREDLIPMILYKAPRVEYEVSPEELEEMTDDGLRALLKELRDRQEKPFPWEIVAIVGGVAVVGVAAVALTARREER